MNTVVNPEVVLSFWFAPQVQSFWFEKNVDFDYLIKQRFLDIYQQAVAGALNHWRDNARGTLALIIILDQFPRNMFRDTPQAYATDHQAVELTKYALNRNYEKNLSIEEQVFLYMPLMHSESQTDQTQCVKLFTKLGKEDNLRFALRHQEIIDRFGRFPHRNQILGRESTPAEQEFLTQPGSSF
ncbi:hypothetical protein NIES4102_36570 [Chondrocystis sp. NIES-4102]|nr:hypothetical protein NIES4102_36570 [Chondrocystis sp. NIES-4102]